MRGLLFVLSLGFLKGIWMRFFLSKPERRNQASPEAVSRVRLTPEGSGWMYEYGWPKRKKPKADSGERKE